MPGSLNYDMALQSRDDRLRAAERHALAGDERSWAAIIERFTARVHKVARRHRLPAHDVDDVVQTTWLRLLEHADSVREPAALGAWLETTARRESLRVIRGAKREVPTDAALGEDEAVEPVEASALVDAECRAALAASVARLPLAQRRVLVAILAAPDRSYAEIARSLGIPIGSIGPTRARSLERLRRDHALARAVDDDAPRAA